MSSAIICLLLGIVGYAIALLFGWRAVTLPKFEHQLFWVLILMIVSAFLLGSAFGELVL
jgi:hypothetical protein